MSGFDFAEYLEAERAMDLLRFSTAGSVDDGKSTLIGRLLYDTQSVFQDQLRSIAGKGTTPPGVLDLALLTDGLRAEREQGITIDVAYRYFSTSRRKFILADTPGHAQYTRNMVTGAATASLALVLVDARRGMLAQSRRHACLALLLGVRQLVLVVNKMDLAGFAEAPFRAAEAEFRGFAAQAAASLGLQRAPELFAVPVSALTGENVVTQGASMPWYAGPALLGLLEDVPAAQSDTTEPFRMAVQLVLRPDAETRVLTGQIASGAVRPGDRVEAYPSRRGSVVTRLVAMGGDLAGAQAPQSIALVLADDLDIGRGELLAGAAADIQIAARLDAMLVWMQEQPLQCDAVYLLKLNTSTVRARVLRVESRLNPETLTHEPAGTLVLNDIGLVRLELLQPLPVEPYERSRVTGSFILMDVATNATAAGGMVRRVVPPEHAQSGAVAVRAEDRALRWGHRGLHLHVAGSADLVDALERRLFERGAFVLRPADGSAAVIAAMTVGGALVITEERGLAAVWIDGQRFEANGVEQIVGLALGLRGEGAKQMP